MLGLSLHRGDLGLEAEEGSIRPVTEELEVLKELVAGLQDVELIREVWGQGGGRRSQPWRFDSQHLWGLRQANRSAVFLRLDWMKVKL